MEGENSSYWSNWIGKKAIIVMKSEDTEPESGIIKNGTTCYGS